MAIKKKTKRIKKLPTLSLAFRCPLWLYDIIKEEAYSRGHTVAFTLRSWLEQHANGHDG